MCLNVRGSHWGRKDEALERHRQMELHILLMSDWSTSEMSLMLSSPSSKYDGLYYRHSPWIRTWDKWIWKLSLWKIVSTSEWQFFCTIFGFLQTIFPKSSLALSLERSFPNLSTCMQTFPLPRLGKPKENIDMRCMTRLAPREHKLHESRDFHLVGSFSVPQHLTQCVHIQSTQ